MKGSISIQVVYPKSVIISMLLSVFHLVYILNIYGGKPPVNVDDNGYCNCCLGSADGNDEEAEEVALKFSREEIPVESHEVDIYRVEYQLN
jgi:hypothetical protein